MRWKWCGSSGRAKVYNPGRVVAEIRHIQVGSMGGAVYIPGNGAPMRFPKLAVLSCIAALGSISLALHTSQPVKASTATAPAYAKNGDMLPPANYREWIYLTTGIDMSYSAQAMSMGEGMSMFDNVFVNPEAYRSFLATGTWPDKTVMVLEGREARSKGSINKRGHFQAVGVSDLAVHVKDEARFPGKWAFFAFDSMDKNGKLIPVKEQCYSCHAEHGAVDTTFVQFYPTLLPVAQKKGTLSAEFLKELQEEKAGR